MVWDGKLVVWGVLGWFGGVLGVVWGVSTDPVSVLRESVSVLRESVSVSTKVRFGPFRSVSVNRDTASLVCLGARAKLRRRKSIVLVALHEISETC